jgi:hypothetical protein
MMTLALGIAAALLTFATLGTGERDQQLKGPLGCGIGQCYAFSWCSISSNHNRWCLHLTLSCNAASARSCHRVCGEHGEVGWLA